VSAAIVFLLSPAAAYITGSCVRVDGGAPNARATWNLEPSQRNKPFEGFHRAQIPKVLSQGRK
jgi:citronellol/citronellal dehydrogenase